MYDYYKKTLKINRKKMKYTFMYGRYPKCIFYNCDNNDTSLKS